jgi:hypothetical protein
MGLSVLTGYAFLFRRRRYCEHSTFRDLRRVIVGGGRHCLSERAYFCFSGFVCSMAWFAAVLYNDRYNVVLIP